MIFLVPWFQDPLMIDKDGNTLVHLAARRGQTEIVRYFIGLANPEIPELVNKNGETPLHCAAANGNLAVFKILSKNAKDMNPKANNGSTPLHEACFNGNRLIFKYLITKVCIVFQFCWKLAAFSCFSKNYNILKVTRPIII